MIRTLLVLTLIVIASLPSHSQVAANATDTAWSSQKAELKDTYEAEYVIRIGDVDNLGFGWPEGFDPFCGRMTQSHSYPWDANPNDLPGFDRILLSSKFNPASPSGCGGDGYSGSYDPATSKPVTYSIPTDIVKGAVVKNAFLQLFIDDFQAPSICSKFQLLVNGRRFAEGEKVLNAIEQSGPVGKLVTLPIPEEFYPSISQGTPFTFKVDETTGAADGFALDFIRLLVNRKRENTCKGNISGTVLDKETGSPIANAKVSSTDNTHAETDADGRFRLNDLPAGFEVLTASAAGYVDGTSTADIGEGDKNDEVTIHLEKGKKAVQFGTRKLSVGESISLNNILFDQGKADLKKTSKDELDKVVAFLTTNITAEIELSGHTSSEGDAALNRSLSYRRVNSCKSYIVSKGIDPGRIIAKGYGPDSPIAPNDTEANRAKNRRVEMRIMKL